MITRPSTVLIDPTADLQGAIDRTPDYGTLYLAPGIYDLPTSSSLQITRPITIEGAGKPYVFENLTTTPQAADTYIGWTSGTVIRPYKTAATSDGGKNYSVFTIVGPVKNVVIRNLGIEHPYIPPTSRPVTAGTGDAIFFDSTLDYVGHCLIENVAIRFMGRCGIYAKGNYGTDPVVSDPSNCVFDQCTFRNVEVVGCRQHGVRLYRAYDLAMEDRCLLVGNEQCGVYAESSFNLIFKHPLFNNNGQSFVRTGTNWKGDAVAWPYWDQAQLYLNGVNGFTIERADLEQFTGAGVGTSPDFTSSRVPHGIKLYGSNTGSIRGVRCYNSGYGDDGVDSTLIFIGYQSKDVTLGENQSGDVTYSLYVQGTSSVQGIKYEPFNIIDHGWGAIANISVPTELDTDSTPTGGHLGIAALGASDKPTLRSFVAGITLPRISGVAAITTDLIEGTLVYDAGAKKLKFYDGSAWRTVTS